MAHENVAENKIASVPTILSKAVDDDDLALEHLVNAIRIEHSSNISKRKADELKTLETGQQKIKFLINLRRVLTMSGKDDGSLEMSDELKKLLEEAQKPGFEDLQEVLQNVGILSDKASYDKEKFKALFEKLNGPDNEELKAKIESLGIQSGKKPSDEQLKQLSELAKSDSAIKNLLNEHNIIGTKTNYSKVEKDNAIDSIRTYVDQYNTMNEMSFQKLTRFESDLDKAYTALMTCLKTLKEIKQRITQGMSPR